MLPWRYVLRIQEEHEFVCRGEGKKDGHVVALDGEVLHCALVRCSHSTCRPCWPMDGIQGVQASPAPEAGAVITFFSGLQSTLKSKQYTRCATS